MALNPREERALFSEVMRVVNEFDLMGLQPGSSGGPPIDEYEPEARAIESVLADKGRIDFSDLSAIWLKWFSNDLRGHEDPLQPFLGALNALVPQNPS